jgi:FkbM family methyltransferase
MIFKKFFIGIKIRFLKTLRKNRGYFYISGIKMFLDYLDPIDRELIETQKYEEKEINFFKKIYSSNKFEYFLDIGANCGYYSIKLANEFNNLKVIAFEPNKEAFTKFTNTLKVNPKLRKRIKIKNFGLSNSSGQLEMTSLEKFGYLQSGGSTIINEIEKKFVKTKIFKCNFKIGTEVLKFKNNKLGIKIDVEGHEYNVIQGLKNLLKENKVILQIEIENKNFKKTDNFLNDIGYKTFNKFIGRGKWISNFYYKNFK